MVWRFTLNRELILREETFAQLVLGLGASAATPLLTLLLLLTMGRAPLLGWGTIWQLVVLSVGGAIATPICFELFGWLQRTLVHRGATRPASGPTGKSGGDDCEV